MVPPPGFWPPAPGPPAPRTTTPLRPPFFQAITFTSAGTTSSAAVGWNRTPCSFSRTFPDGVRWPFIIWDSMAELIPARRAVSFWLIAMCLHAVPQGARVNGGGLGRLHPDGSVQHGLHPRLHVRAQVPAAPGHVRHVAARHPHPVRQFPMLMPSSRARSRM